VLKNLFRNRSGASAIEYALLACVMAIMILTSLHSISDSVSAMFQTIADEGFGG
jgi:Flp pilus assembly pilin Flp